MDFRKLTDDLNIISALGDNPNADNALTPSGLKAKFDEAALKIKRYLNEVLIPDLYTAVESEEFRGQPGLSPTVEAERFQDSAGSGVKLVITTPAPPDSGLLDSIISIPLYDGANGVTPKISNVDIEVLENGADASAEITGPTNNLNLLLKIPRGEPGRDGQTPAFRLASAYMLPYGAYPEVTISGPTADLRMQLGIPQGAPGYTPQKDVDYRDGKDGFSPTVTITKKRLSDGRMEATIAVINADGSSQSATVTDGKDGNPGVRSLIWRNDNIYAEFLPQAIEADTNKYLSYEMLFFVKPNEFGSVHSQIITPMIIDGLVVGTGNAASIDLSGSHFTRTVNIEDGSITFGEGWRDGGVSNWSLVPALIYGVGAASPAYALTKAEKAEMVNSVLAALPVYNGEVAEV